MITLTQKFRVKKIPKSFACLEAELLHEVLLDILQTVHAVLDIHVNLRPL